MSRCYFERNTSYGLFSENSTVIDIDNYKSPAAGFNNQFTLTFTGAIAAPDRGYRKQEKYGFTGKEFEILTAYGTAPTKLRAIGNSDNVGLRYGSHAVVVNRGENLIDPSKLESNRTNELKGWNSTYGGYEISGTASNGTEGIDTTVTIQSGQTYILEWATSTIQGTPPNAARVGSNTGLSNGVPFTAIDDGEVACRLFGPSGATYESYVTAFSLSKVQTDTELKGQATATTRLNTPSTRGHISKTSAPSTGGWAQGEIVWNSSPASGQPIGWVCTVSGNPGTWSAFGTIA